MSVSSEHALGQTTGRTVSLQRTIPWTERYFRLLWGAVGIVGFILVWQLAVVSGFVDRLFVSDNLRCSRISRCSRLHLLVYGSVD